MTQQYIDTGPVDALHAAPVHSEEIFRAFSVDCVETQVDERTTLDARYETVQSYSEHQVDFLSAFSSMSWIDNCNG